MDVTNGGSEEAGFEEMCWILEKQQQAGNIRTLKCSRKSFEDVNTFKGLTMKEYTCFQISSNASPFCCSKVALALPYGAFPCAEENQILPAICFGTIAPESLLHYEWLQRAFRLRSTRCNWNNAWIWQQRKRDQDIWQTLPRTSSQCMKTG